MEQQQIKTMALVICEQIYRTKCKKCDLNCKCYKIASSLFETGCRITEGKEQE